eukprot:12531279-Alexandrium_andersonii.AAC.1
MGATTEDALVDAAVGAHVFATSGVPGEADVLVHDELELAPGRRVALVVVHPEGGLRGSEP